MYVVFILFTLNFKVQNLFMCIYYDLSQYSDTSDHLRCDESAYWEKKKSNTLLIWFPVISAVFNCRCV